MYVCMCICDERSDERKGRRNSKVSGMSHMYVCMCVCICVFVTRSYIYMCVCVYIHI
jgi:hypothetical protein